MLKSLKQVTITLLIKGHYVISIIVSCSQCHDNITNVQTTSVLELNLHVSIYNAIDNITKI